MKHSETLRLFFEEHLLDMEALDLTPTGVLVNIHNEDFRGWYIVKYRNENPEEEIIILHDWRLSESFYFPDLRKERSTYAKILKDEKDGDEKSSEEKVAEEISRQVYEETRKICEENFKDCDASFDRDIEYFVKKKLSNPGGARSRTNSFGKKEILVPLKDFSGVLWSIQTIEAHGDKQFVSSSKTKASFFQWGSFSPKSRLVYLCEGWATGGSIHEATGEAVLCAMGANNLKEVAQSFRKKFDVPLIVCADRDESGVGLASAKDACAWGLAHFILPELTRGTDFNDLHVTQGLDEVKRQLSLIQPIPPQELSASEFQGFHKIVSTKQGDRLVPDVDALYKYFSRQFAHFTVEESDITYAFNGKHYSEMRDLNLENFAERHFDPPVQNNVIQEFKHKVKRSRIKPYSFFERPSDSKVNFGNGILDMKKKVLLPHSAEESFSYVLPFDYDAEAKAPVFQATLNRVFGGDPELTRQFLEFMGYTLSGDACWVQKALVLEGRGNNGKSTVIDIMRYVIGEKTNCSALTLPDLGKEYSLHCLDGKLANFSEETPNRTGQDTSPLKNIITGGVVQARAPYKLPYSMRPRAKFIFACNELPSTSDITDGFFRRLCIIPFNKTFTPNDSEYDPHIGEKMKREASGIFNLCLDAYLALLARGHWVDAEASEKILAEYREESDAFSMWVQDNLDLFGKGVLPIQKIYGEFRLDLEQQGVRFVPTRSVFTRRLRKLLSSPSRFIYAKVEGKTTRVVTGVDLREMH